MDAAKPASIYHMGMEYTRYEYQTSKHTIYGFYAPCPETALAVAAEWERQHGVTFDDSEATREIMRQAITAVADHPTLRATYQP